MIDKRTFMGQQFYVVKTKNTFSVRWRKDREL